MEKINKNDYTGLISHHGLKYTISTQIYEKIKDNNNFIVLLEKYIEGLEHFSGIISFFIILVLIFNNVQLLPSFIIILFANIILTYISVKIPIYKVPFLCLFSYYIGNIFNFLLYIVILLLSIFYTHNFMIFLIYILAIILSNILATVAFKVNTYTSTLDRNNKIVKYILNLIKYV